MLTIRPLNSGVALRARDHALRHLLRDEKCALHVGIEDMVEVGRRRFGQALRGGDTGVVDQDVDRSDRAFGVFDRIADRVGLGHVELNDVRGATGRFDLGAQVLQSFDAARRQHRERPVGRQHPREASPEPTARAGDERDLFLQIGSHGLPFPIAES